MVRANLSAMKFDVDHGWRQRGITTARATITHDHRITHHHHRKASEILSMIRQSGLNANTKRIADGIFTKLAISEGKVHHIPPEDVEFHEVGAVDSIVDTVGAAIGFDALGIERFVCSPINVGSGFIHCQHGVYPVPAPATADLAAGRDDLFEACRNRTGDADRRGHSCGGGRMNSRRSAEFRSNRSDTAPAQSSFRIFRTACG